VIVSNLVSLDGFIAGPQGEIDWFVSMADKEFESYSVELIESVDTMLFGRVTYELMAGYWPTARPPADDQRIIDGMNNTAKVVFSRTLTRVEWSNSRLASGSPADIVAGLKARPGRNIVLYGSGSIVAALADRGLIDDYRIFVAPVILGSGKPQFAGARTNGLRLAETRTFASGLALLRYAPADAA
jgi:dihydrofolate reductase